MIMSVSNQMFAEFVNQLCENCTVLEDQINLIAEKIVNEIQNQINEYRAEKISRDCAIMQIYNIVKGLEKIIIPLTVAQSTNINFQDKNQYIYDLNKDIRLHIEKNIPEMEKYLCVGFVELLKESFAQSKWEYVLPTVYCLKFEPFLEIGAVIVVVVSFLIYLTVIFAKSEIKRNKANSIATRKIKLSIPPLWEKVKENTSIVRELCSVDKVKGLSFFTLFSKELIIVLEDTNSNFMKLIIQSMTGIDCHFKEQINENKEAILYGPITKTTIMERILRNYQSSQDESYNQKILILYLRGYDEDDLHQIENIQSKASFFMSSEISLCHLPTVKNKKIHLFFTCPNEDVAIIKKQELENLQKNLNCKIQSDDFQIIVWPVLMKNKKNIELIGPQTNKSLRFDFHQIFGNKKDEK